MGNKISDIKGRMLLDSRGMPTVEAEVILSNGVKARAISPSGASKGRYESYERRDSDGIFLGKSVYKNVNFINNPLKEVIIGMDVEDQLSIDKKIVSLDGTKNKSKLGCNTTIALSMAVIKAAAKHNKQELWQYLADDKILHLPLPQVQIIGGGLHAKDSVSIQDFLIIPNGAPNFMLALEWIFIIYNKAGELLKSKGKLKGVADEGGYWPDFKTSEEVLKFLTNVINKAGFKPYKEISIALDIAGNNFKYKNNYKLDKELISGTDLLTIILNWVKKYPIISIEDPFAEEDISLFRLLKLNAPNYLQIVGDDLVVTNKVLIKNAYENNCINSLLIKPNQIGTLSETKESLDLAKSLNLMNIISARSGETEDTTISDLCVGWGVEQLKVGSISRSERNCKWNQCIRIGEKIKNNFIMGNVNNLNWNSL